jgi:aminoglycoside 2'-N-acetyltransferase I
MRGRSGTRRTEEERRRTPDPDGARVRHLRTDELTPVEISALRRLMHEAFGSDEEERFSEDDWQHALGGVHFVLDMDGKILAHAAVVERELHAGGRPLRTGYVEAVATAPAHQRKGYGSAVMRPAGAHIRKHFELGALGTSSHGFYERLGWETWRGPTYVRTSTGLQRTADEDGYILVLRTPRSPALVLTDPISCDWRPGDVW